MTRTALTTHQPRIEASSHGFPHGWWLAPALVLGPLGWAALIWAVT